MQLAELSADVARLNHPVVDLAAALQPDTLAAYLDYEFQQHQTRVAELAAAFARFLVATAGGITSEEVTGKATDFAKQHKAEIAAIDDTRTRIKAPVLHAQRLIDSSGKQLADPLKASVTVIEQRIAVFLTAKATAARQAAEQEAQRLAAQAHTAMMATQDDHSPEARETAIEQFDAARQAETLATAPVQELSRTRSLNGAMAGLKQTWTYEIIDLSLVPPHLLQINDAAVKAAIKGGSRAVPGLRIYAEHKAFVR